MYISVDSSSSRVIIINVSRGILSDKDLAKIFGQDKIKEALSRLIPKVKEIASKGYHPNSKGVGKIAHKDAGDTLENLLGIKTNNSQKADFEDLIELKSKTSKTLDRYAWSRI